MYTRRIKKRNCRTKRFHKKQKGGNRLLNFTITNNETLLITEENQDAILRSLEKNTDYTIDMIHEGKTHCTLKFNFNTVGELAMLICPNRDRIETYKYKSYFIIGFFLQAMKIYHNIQTVYLMPAPDEEAEYFTKLHGFYRNLGFICIGDDKALETFKAMNTNNTRISFLNSKKAASNSIIEHYIKKNTAKPRTLTNENKTELLTTHCMYMAGNIDVILTNIRTAITAWQKESEASADDAAGAGAAADEEK